MFTSFLSKLHTPVDLTLIHVINSSARLDLDEKTAHKVFDDIVKQNPASLTAVDSNGWTPFMHAVNVRNLFAIRWLLTAFKQQGLSIADKVNQRSNKANKHTFALMLAIKNLLHTIPVVNQDEEKQHASLQHLDRRSIAIIETLLGIEGLNINQTDVDGTTALMIVATLPGDQTALLELLLKHKAIIKLTTRLGHNALQHAVCYRNLRVIEKLLEKGGIKYKGDCAFLQANASHANHPEETTRMIKYLYAYARLEPDFVKTKEDFSSEHSYFSPYDYVFYSGFIKAAKSNQNLFQAYIEACLKNGSDDFKIDAQNLTGAFPWYALYINLIFDKVDTHANGKYILQMVLKNSSSHLYWDYEKWAQSIMRQVQYAMTLEAPDLEMFLLAEEFFTRFVKMKSYKKYSEEITLIVFSKACRENDLLLLSGFMAHPWSLPDTCTAIINIFQMNATKNNVSSAWNYFALKIIHSSSVFDVVDDIKRRDLSEFLATLCEYSAEFNKYRQILQTVTIVDSLAEKKRKQSEFLDAVRAQIDHLVPIDPPEEKIIEAPPPTYAAATKQANKDAVVSPPFESKGGSSYANRLKLLPPASMVLSVENADSHAAYSSGNTPK